MDLEKVEALLKLMHEYGVAELGYEDEAGSVELRLQGAAPPVAAQPPAPGFGAAPPAISTAPAHEADTITVDSPMVGTFYRSSKPGAKAFVDVGDTVGPGTILCILEAMKLMNELECDVSGTIVEILAENAQPVQFGQALFRVRLA